MKFLLIYKKKNRPRSEGFSDGKIGLALAPALAPPPKMPVHTASSDDYSPPKSLNPFLMPEQVPVTTTCESKRRLVTIKIKISLYCDNKFFFLKTNRTCLRRGNRRCRGGIRRTRQWRRSSMRINRYLWRCSLAFSTLVKCGRCSCGNPTRRRSQVRGKIIFSFFLFKIIIVAY